MRRLLKWLAFIAIIVAIVLAVRSCGNDESVVSETAPPTTLACSDGFSLKLDPHIGGDVISGGIPAGLTNDQKRDFVLERAKQDPSILQFYYNDMPVVKELRILQPISDPKSLAVEWKNDACWTAEGIKKYEEWATLFKLTDVRPIPLPVVGMNTGAHPDGTGFQVSGPVPSGTGTQFDYRDANGKPLGKTMVRNECGNVVSPAPIPGVPSKPSVPVPPAPQPTTHVPTTVPLTTTTTVPPTTTTTVPPTTTTTVPPPPPVTVVPKDPNEDPYPKGNAPQGGGRNEDPGPGPYIPPSEMERPPATSRTNPPPPPPAPVVPNVPDEPISTPTPTTLITIPPVEPGAGSGETNTPDSGNGNNGANDGDVGGF